MQDTSSATKGETVGEEAFSRDLEAWFRDAVWHDGDDVWHEKFFIANHSADSFIIDTPDGDMYLEDLRCPAGPMGLFVPT